jgi:PAS domain S-box-containing protein
MMNMNEDVKDFFEAYKHLPLPVLVHRDQKIETVNQSFASTFGFKVEDLQNLSIKNLIKSNRGPVSYGQNQKLITIKPRSGRQIWCTMREGKLDKYTISVITPTTKEEVNLETVKEKEKQLRSLAQHIPKTFFVLFQNTMDIAVAQGPGLKAFDCSRTKLEGKQLNEILPPNKLSEIEGYLKRTWEGEELKIFKKVKNVHFKIEFIPVQDDYGKVLSSLMISQDVTRQLEADRENLRDEKMLLTSRISRSIAHEVRNPLTNIDLALDHLKENEKSVSEEAELYFDIISRNSKRINNLINEILQSTKPTSIQLREVPTNKLIKAVEESTKDRFELTNVKFHKRNSLRDKTVCIDYDKMVMALTNIVINATEAVPTNSGKVWLSIWENEGRAVVSIRDNGKGMNDEELERIYDPFQTGKRGGMGLGLTSSLNIIKAHNSKIHVKSKPGEGTTFYCYLNPGPC